MSITQRVTNAASRYPSFEALLNPAVIKGGFGLTVGALILLLPTLSLFVVEIAVGIGLLVSGFLDLRYALSGRRARGQGSRWLAPLRGLLSLLFAALIALSPTGALDLLVFLVGAYLGLRGLITVAAGLFARDPKRRTPRLVGGLAAIAVGVLAVTAPDTLARGLIVGASLAAIVGGAIVLAYGLRAARADTPDYDPANATLAEILWDWVRTADVGEDWRSSVSDTIYFEEPGLLGKLTAWWVMLLLSVSIATFAVIQDSTAVVIGAMLVAPLMVPILGLAGALVNGWRRRAFNSARLVGLGVLASVTLAYALSAWTPTAVSFETNTQITSRVSPGLLDMLIAIAAGAAGAFATINPRVAPSIAGVAIAVALVPPLSVVGISLGAGRFDDAFGAFLLFATNFVSIVLSAAAVFVLTGYADSTTLIEQSRTVLLTVAPFGTLGLIILIPLVFTSQGLLVSTTQQAKVETSVTEWIGDGSDLKVQEVVIEGESVTVSVIGSDQPPTLDSLQGDLTADLNRPVSVELELIPVVRSSIDRSGRVEQQAAPTLGASATG